jgi:hypothetical protein
MEGTQIPINIASFVFPLKYKISEKIRERNAAINNNLSVVVNLFSMILFIFKCRIGYLKDININ